MKETSYELLKDYQKKQLNKNNEVKMTLYNSLPCKEYERGFMCKPAKEVCHTLIITHQGNSQVKDYRIDLLTQQYEKFSVSSKETINSGFTRFNVIVISLKSLDQDYSSKNHVRKFLRALPLKWRAKVTAIEEAKYLATLPLDEIIVNLKVYEMILENNGVAFKTTKEKVKSLALNAKVTREQTTDDSDSQEESDEDVDEEEAEAFNLIDRNFRKFFHKGNRFGRGNRFGNGENKFKRGRGMVLETKEVKAQDKGDVATIAAKKFTSLVGVQSPKKTRPLLEELGVIVKTVMNLKTMQHVSWQSNLKRINLKTILKRDTFKLKLITLSSWDDIRFTISALLTIGFSAYMGDDVDISTLTIEQYLALTQDNIRPGVVKPEIGSDVEFEINSNFMRELRRKLFAGTDDEDAHEHVQRVLVIVDLFHFPSVTHDAIIFRVFPIILKGPALYEILYQAWER
uniref:DUF4219 domain-containing protein/UBN2 domain-containing protein n=1 Tax=Tanacetum cinerariifolium TaxID=118510 RepID=A0A699H8X8_TANCI|nr:DUF4219 domain-containing protein/UBN2 domain-containing protein [Tanacetum cinerariifolium]